MSEEKKPGSSVPEQTSPGKSGSLGHGIDALIAEHDNERSTDDSHSMPPTPPRASSFRQPTAPAGKDRTRIPASTAVALIGAGALGTIVIAAITLALSWWAVTVWHDGKSAENSPSHASSYTYKHGYTNSEYGSTSDGLNRHNCPDNNP